MQSKALEQHGRGRCPVPTWHPPLLADLPLVHVEVLLGMHGGQAWRHAQHGGAQQAEDEDVAPVFFGVHMRVEPVHAESGMSVVQIHRMRHALFLFQHGARKHTTRLGSSPHL